MSRRARRSEPGDERCRASYRQQRASCLICLTRHRVRQSDARRARKRALSWFCLVFDRDERGHVLSHLSHVPVPRETSSERLLGSDHADHLGMIR
jgi:hypothetical protein